MRERVKNDKRRRNKVVAAKMKEKKAKATSKSFNSFMCAGICLTYNEII